MARATSCCVRPVAVLEVDRDRQARRPIERAGVLDDLVEGRGAVGAAQREREARARARERLEAQAREDLGRAGVPRVGDDERVALVQRTEVGALLMLCRWHATLSPCGWRHDLPRLRQRGLAPSWEARSTARPRRAGGPGQSRGRRRGGAVGLSGASSGGCPADRREVVDGGASRTGAPGRLRSRGSSACSASRGSAGSPAPARRPGGTGGRSCRRACRRGSCPSRTGSRARRSVIVSSRPLDGSTSCAARFRLGLATAAVVADFARARLLSTQLWS